MGSTWGELQGTGRLRYANNSNYKKDTLIKKECHVSPLVVETVREMVLNSGILECDDAGWPLPDSSIGKQELEIVCAGEHISFCCAKIGRLKEVTESKDPGGLKRFYFLAQDLKACVFSLMSLHFRINPVQ